MTRFSRLVLLGLAMGLAPIAGAAIGPAVSAGPLGAGGTILMLSRGSITVGMRPEQVAWEKAAHPGRQLPANTTCKRDTRSPAFSGFRVGEYVAIRCSGGTLIGIQPDRQWAGGTIRKLDSESLEVGYGFSWPGVGPPPGLSCLVGHGSPSTVRFHLGDAVRIECLGGVLKMILTGNNGWNGYVESGGGRAIPPSTAGI